FAAVVAYFLVGTVAGPVARIAKAMQEAAERGDPSEVSRLPIPQQDEVGMLAAGVNTMFDRLGASAAEIRIQADNLERQNHALIEAARMKSQFLANMSHELRTPLNAIIGFSRIVGRKAQGKLDETQLNNLRLIHQSGQQLLTLVNDMLDFERIESGRLQVVMAPVDAAEVATQVHATLLPAAEKKGLTLELSLARPQVPIVSDADRLRQILINLVNNAIKYSDSGHIVLSLVLQPSHLQVEVADEGIGIPPEHLQRIFDPFYQVDPSSTREREGAGLGLAIVHKLSTLLGGSLNVKSQPGTGSTFTLELPLPAQEPARVAGDGPVVLIIDDEIKDREILKTELTEMGFRVEAAASGREGLDRAREVKPAAIVLDLLMPEMPGLEVLKALRQDAETARIPVVVATVQDKVPHGFDPGITAWLTKPVETEELRTNLRRALQGIRTDDVLVVEDDAATCALIEQELSALSYRVRTVADGAAALEAIAERVPQAVILDLMLPQMDGFELLQRLRGQVPVVIYTGRDLSSAEQERLSAGLVEVVRKHGERGVQGVLESLSRVLS
ncbi:MAG: response regulator, partial [Candidatus Xenobia bacterium]